MVGLMGFGGICGYVAAKHGQVGLMRAVAAEVAPRRIRVNTLHPGPTSTLFRSEIEMAATGLPADQAARCSTTCCRSSATPRPRRSPPRSCTGQ